MGIYAPNPRFSRKDKRLLALIARILLEHMNREVVSDNIPSESIPISDSEAEELVGLLQQLLESREFIEKAYFVEQISDQSKFDDGSLKEIFLSYRKKFGRTRVASSHRWLDFQHRIGFGKEIAGMLLFPPMDFDYFLNMEHKLFRELGLHPRVIELLLDLVNSRRNDIEMARAGKKYISKGKIRESVRNLTKSIQNDQLVSPHRTAATLTILANLSVLFSTRDWSVAGTISTMTGAFAVSTIVS